MYTKRKMIEDRKMIIRSKTFESWMRANFDRSQLSDIASHGADAGWPKLTYTADCVDIYNRFEDEIWEALNEDADDFGHRNPAELIATFGRADMLSDARSFKNLLVWYMAERTAQRLTDR